MDYFKKHPNEDLKHGPVVDWVTERWLKEHKEPPRDPWRAIRALHQEGILIKVKKGIYKYEPDYVKNVELFEFSSETKEKIFKKDNYKCGSSPFQVGNFSSFGSIQVSTLSRRYS